MLFCFSQVMSLAAVVDLVPLSADHVRRVLVERRRVLHVERLHGARAGTPPCARLLREARRAPRRSARSSTLAFGITAEQLLRCGQRREELSRRAGQRGPLLGLELHFLARLRDSRRDRDRPRWGSQPHEEVARRLSKVSGAGGGGPDNRRRRGGRRSDLDPRRAPARGGRWAASLAGVAGGGGAGDGRA